MAVSLIRPSPGAKGIRKHARFLEVKKIVVVLSLLAVYIVASGLEFESPSGQVTIDQLPLPDCSQRSASPSCFFILDVVTKRQ